MATLLTDDSQLETTNPRTVGGALVWDVVKASYDSGRMTSPGVHRAVVGKIVLRDGIMFARDVTACGEPLILEARYGNRLNSMLAAASAVLFA